jgi:hypothetical protein
MKTITNTSYKIATKGMGGYFSPHSYSKYNERWGDCQKNLIMPWDVYGYEQALEHIEEIRNYQSMDCDDLLMSIKPIKPYENTEFVISITTTVTTEIPIRKQ